MWTLVRSLPAVKLSPDVLLATLLPPREAASLVWAVEYTQALAHEPAPDVQQWTSTDSFRHDQLRLHEAGSPLHKLKDALQSQYPGVYQDVEAEFQEVWDAAVAQKIEALNLD